MKSILFYLNYFYSIKKDRQFRLMKKVNVPYAYKNLIMILG